MPSTIKDVARKAGVSSATVSRALAGKPHVRADVLTRIQEAARELDYRPSRVARSLRVQQSSIIGLIISDILNPFFTALVRAVEDAASQNGYAVFLCNSDESVDKERMYLELMESEQVAGVLLSPTHELDGPARRLVQNGTPVVAFDRRLSDVPMDSVLVDNFQGAYQAVGHLIEQGHTRIAIAAAHPNRTTGRERLNGYRAAIADHHLPQPEEYVFTGVPNRMTGRAAAERFCRLPEKPTAVFCGNNLLTEGVMGYLKQTGCDIPGDFGLVSFDDMEWYAMCSPTITAVRQPVYEMGRLAARMLFERISGDQSPAREIILKTELILRESSQSPRR
ncbi:MAG: LacI family DNA-binding transcriptional regulator [Anaerolineaceae bacterium]